MRSVLDLQKDVCFCNSIYRIFFNILFLKFLGVGCHSDLFIIFNISVYLNTSIETQVHNHQLQDF